MEAVVHSDAVVGVAREASPVVIPSAAVFPVVAEASTVVEEAFMVAVAAVDNYVALKVYREKRSN